MIVTDSEMEYHSAEGAVIAMIIGFVFGAAIAILGLNGRLGYVDKISRAKVTEIARSSVPEIMHMSLIMHCR